MLELAHIAIAVSKVQAYGLVDINGGGAFVISGSTGTDPATDISLSDLIIDWPGGSPANVFCVELVQSTARVTMSGINCKNVAIGINYIFPNPGFMGDISLTNSQFASIAASAVNTYGDWTASGNTCNNVTLNCFVNNSGNLHLGVNTVLTTGAYFNNVAGTMQFDYLLYMNGSSAPVQSPGEVAGSSNATSGGLTGAVFNTTSTSYSGPINWSCKGLLQ